METVTGPSSSAVATTRPAALSEKIRQNNDTFLDPPFPALAYDTARSTLSGDRPPRISVTTPMSSPYGRMTACGRGPSDDRHQSQHRQKQYKQDELGEETCQLRA
ncbi:hypothetical protein GCM10010383_66930 [Streptomyces lomondensis]|uniref:Uncharacterized protein n=1 Tax=Streptomyces lomondensis TaxID=68229 RepID=A0ABQ2XPA4_9ACTN|nr:hypothetical protein GCM10010383_66930 [Streptomyces lomondensis]